MNRVWNDIESLLQLVSRPGRYTGNEIHARRKNPRRVDVTFALAFPDVYEIGMSHIGLGILYHVLNRTDWIAAERVYSPWIDLEDLLRKHKIPLFSLESKIPIKAFDILGVTLQYELHYTNILNILDLSDIPLRSADRSEDDPLVIGGGPCAYNPEPLAPFFDVFALGDGEEIIVEITEIVRKVKAKQGGRKEILDRLSRIDGVYIPAFYHALEKTDERFVVPKPIDTRARKRIKSRILERLHPGNYPVNPIVPLIEVTHDRFSMEIMRGCTRGCRFCNAGMMYRPVRERSVDELVAHAEEVISNTGYDEISLISLSTSDYSQLPELLDRLREQFREDVLSISFPSLRPDTFTSQMADAASGLRRGGLTLAPEAGTQRLRDVINKNTQEQDLLNAVEIAFGKGWRHVKLYFMIGLPTETSEDIQGIVDLVGKVVHLSRRFGKKEISVSISPFSPKPNTPFQWQEQDHLEVMEKKLGILRKGIAWRETKLNWRNPEVSRLETILGRGDRRLARVIERVWGAGARFEAWSDRFQPALWHEAFNAEGLSPEIYTESIDSDTSLPWDHLNGGILKTYLIRERKKALNGKTTGDCRSEDCHDCGLMDHIVCSEGVSSKRGQKKIGESKVPKPGRNVKRESAQPVRRMVRLEYTKGDRVRYTSHLDTMRIWIRALKRAGIPMVFSEGFHAHPRFATGPPLTLGFTSLAEYADIEVARKLPVRFQEKINYALPDGMSLNQFMEINEKGPSLNNAITQASYTVSWTDLPEPNDVKDRIDQFLKRNSYRVKRLKKGVEREVDIRLYVDRLDSNCDSIEMLLRLTPQGTARVREVVDAIIPEYDESIAPLRIVRTGLYVNNNGKRVSPMEGM